MAKKAAEKTKTQIAADKARDAYSKAKDANDKADNATTKAALDAAKIVRDTAVTAESRERFVRVGGARVEKTITALTNVGKMNVPRSYNYTATDVDKLEAAITATTKTAIDGLRAALNKTAGTTAAKSGFSFE